MKTRNEVNLAGTLSSDVEDFCSNGAKFTLQTIEEYKTKEGEIKKEKTRHTIIAWNFNALKCKLVLKKKSKVELLRGFLKYRKHKNLKGEDVVTTEIHVLEIAVDDSKYYERLNAILTSKGPIDEETFLDLEKDIYTVNSDNHGLAEK